LISNLKIGSNPGAKVSSKFLKSLAIVLFISNIANFWPMQFLLEKIEKNSDFNIVNSYLGPALNARCKKGCFCGASTEKRSGLNSKGFSHKSSFLPMQKGEMPTFVPRGITLPSVE
jgi:hypothetical protein